MGIPVLNIKNQDIQMWCDVADIVDMAIWHGYGEMISVCTVYLETLKQTQVVNSRLNFPRCLLPGWCRVQRNDAVSGTICLPFSPVLANGTTEEAVP